MKNTILELYSGIGGMHCAWQESNLMGNVAAAIDINTVANEVYHHNFPNTYLTARNIQKLTVAEINKMSINTILMSPPCQPFTRNGKNLDSDDPRTNSFIYLMSILQDLHQLQYILLENVKGFECSSVRNIFINKLTECGFDYQEFLLCPNSLGVPNSRLRYYCIARRTNTTWNFKRSPDILSKLSNDYGPPTSLNEIIEKSVPENQYLVPSKLLRCAKVFDICNKDSTRSCCFTKAYSHYADGTGSLYTELSMNQINEIYTEADSFDVGSKEFINCIEKMNLRFFTPREILRIMSFPESFNFPNNITMKQCYRLIGNSVNIKVIAELLKVLFD